MSIEPEEFLKSYKGLLGGYLKGAVAAAYVNGLLLIAQSWLFAGILNAVIFEKASVWDMLLYPVALVFIFMLRFICAFFAQRLAFLGAQRVKRALRSALQDKLRNLGPVFITGQGSGSLLAMLGEAVEKLEAYYASYLPAKTLMVLLPFSVLVVVAPVDWLSGIFLAVSAPLIPLFMMLIGREAESLNRKQWRKLSRMSNYFLDVVQGITTLKVFNAARREGNTIGKISDEYRRDTMDVLRLAFLSSVTLEFFSTLSIALVAVFIGFRLMWGEMLFFPGFFILLLAPEFYLPLRKMGAAYHARMEAIGAVDKMIEVMGVRGTLLAGQKNISFSGNVAFENVGFSYEGGRKALSGVNFAISPGEHVALIGPSGAGKSSVFSLLLGFVAPDSGKILIDGQDLSDLDIDEWRKNISWIPQNPTLFCTSVFDNITFGRDGCLLKDVRAMCEILGFDEFISNLPQGYDTMVGERGYGLSGGQIRRIAVARAFMRDAPLVLMDEPTASLDAGTEKILQHAMQDLCKGKTVLTIAHRLYSVRQADEIIFMKEGEVYVRGNHVSLYRDSEKYRHLIDCELPYIAGIFEESGAV